MKRIFLFLATNLAIVFVLSITMRLLGVDRYLTANGLNLTSLLIFAAVMDKDNKVIRTERWLDPYDPKNMSADTRP